MTHEPWFVAVALAGSILTHDKTFGQTNICRDSEILNKYISVSFLFYTLVERYINDFRVLFLVFIKVVLNVRSVLGDELEKHKTT